MFVAIEAYKDVHRLSYWRKARKRRRAGGFGFGISRLCIILPNLVKNNNMIKANTTIKSIKDMVMSLNSKPVMVKLNLGRNKYVTFPATLSGIYPSLFTVSPDDKNFLGKTAYSYSEILCGRVKLSERTEKSG